MRLSRWISSAAACAALLACGAAAAVSRSTNGEGQVLIYPYFTTAAGNATLLSVVNGRGDAKVLSVRFAEGRSGATLMQFHVYLGPYDTWTATVFGRGIATPGLLTADRSCTYPEILQSTFLPQLPDGRRYLPFGQVEPGAGTAADSSEGFIEIVEMATTAYGTPTFAAISPPAGERYCARLIDAWLEPTGTWVREPLRDLDNPSGGIGGTAAVVNVARGTVFALPAVALDDFRVDPRLRKASVAMNPRPRPDAPSLLDQALSDPDQGIATATLISRGRVIQASYPVPEQAVDAVAAVLSAEQLRGEFDTTAAVGATTSFVLTHPLRRFYAGPPLTAPVLPYLTLIERERPLHQSGSTLPFRAYDQDQQLIERSYPPEGCGWLCPPMPSVRTPGTAVEVVSVSGQPDPLLGTRLHGDIGFSSANGTRPLQGTGLLLLEPGQHLSNGDWMHRLRPSREGYRFLGLPVLGTRLVNYVNANVSGGVLANYSFAVPMTAESACEKQVSVPCRETP